MLKLVGTVITNNNMTSNPISSLYFPKFRLLMYVHVLLSTGFWLQQIVIGWYIYDQTNSPLFTTLALSVDTIPILFGGFIGGALVDRFNPKKCIIFVTIGQCVFVSILAVILFIETLPLLYIYPVIFCIGFTWVIYDPAKISLGMKLVDKDNISNIFGMWIAGFNLPRILASIGAGYLIVLIGPQYVLLVEISFISIAFLCISLLKYDHSISQNHKPTFNEIYVDIKDLFNVMKKDEIVTGFFLLSFTSIFLLVPSTTGLLPVYASDILKLDARGLGILQSFCGIGQISGIVFMGMIKQKYIGYLAIWALLISACFAIFFSISTIYYLSFLFIFVVNICIAIFHNSTSYAMFSTIEERFRGRLAGLQVSSFGLFIFGSTFAGVLANVYGPTVSTITSMAIMIVISSLITLKYRRIYSISI